MDSIKEAFNYLICEKKVRHWPELVHLLSEIFIKPSPHWRIPEIVCQAVGGSQAEVIPATAAVVALHTSIVIVDDLLDEDDRFKAFGWMSGDLANLAQAIAAAGFDAIMRGPSESNAKMNAILYLNDMMLRTAAGQFMDKHNLIQNEADYWFLVQSKSAPFFETAFVVSALLGGATVECIDNLGKVGALYGEMVQIHDDLKDALSTPASADWQNDHASLPILFARTVTHPLRDEFIQLYQNITVPDSLKTAQKILFQSGGVSYCVKKLLERGYKAHKLLQEIALLYPEPLEQLIHNIMRPVSDIFKNSGIPTPLNWEDGIEL